MVHELYFFENKTITIMRIFTFLFAIFFSAIVYGQTVSIESSFDIKTKIITITATNEFKHAVKMLPNPNEEKGPFKGTFYTIKYIDEHGKELYLYRVPMLLKRAGLIGPLEKISQEVKLREVYFSKVKTIEVQIDIEAIGLKKEWPYRMGIVFKDTIIRKFNLN